MGVEAKHGVLFLVCHLIPNDIPRFCLPMIGYVRHRKGVWSGVTSLANISRRWMHVLVCNGATAGGGGAFEKTDGCAHERLEGRRALVTRLVDSISFSPARPSHVSREEWRLSGFQFAFHARCTRTDLTENIRINPWKSDPILLLLRVKVQKGQAGKAPFHNEDLSLLYMNSRVLLRRAATGPLRHCGPGGSSAT